MSVHFCHRARGRDHTQVHSQWVECRQSEYFGLLTCDFLLKIIADHKRLFNEISFSSPFCCQWCCAWLLFGQCLRGISICFISFFFLCYLLKWVFLLVRAFHQSEVAKIGSNMKTRLCLISNIWTRIHISMNSLSQGSNWFYFTHCISSFPEILRSCSRRIIITTIIFFIVIFANNILLQS